MKFRKYSHKFIEVVAGSFMVRLKDEREDAPESKIHITLFPAGKSGGQGVPFERTIELSDAVKLRDALSKVLKHAPKPKSQKED